MYLKKPHIITMQTFQMAIMLLFETTNALTCGEIQEMLKLSQDILYKHISSLLECKLLTSETEVIQVQSI